MTHWLKYVKRQASMAKRVHVKAISNEHDINLEVERKPTSKPSDQQQNILKPSTSMKTFEKPSTRITSSGAKHHVT